MKAAAIIVSVFLFLGRENGSGKTYTASTPAHPLVRYFLGIPLTDSIDFIRWRLELYEGNYQLQCNYGVCKPNTNGFINGGTKIEITGAVQKEQTYYCLTNRTHRLKYTILNTDLLHLLNEDNSLLPGNAGWSYTLNNISPSIADHSIMVPAQLMIKDSMVYVGRTPCKIPGSIATSSSCYKLKWRLALYTDPGKKAGGTYSIYGNRWAKANPANGNWTSSPGKNGSVVYQLYDSAGNIFSRLLQPGANILLFTDLQGKLLVGDEDFSYTLNRQ